MTREQYNALTAGERNYMRQIERRRQPECPGCGMEMRPQIFLRPDLSEETGAVIPGRFHWAADYCCDASHGGCGCWSTNIVRSKSPVAAMDAAWKRAMRRFEK